MHGPALRKVLTDGTHRVRRAEETWEIIAPKLPRYGITRIADVTKLDTLGIPVMMAVRPLAKTLSVSQGKGRTPLLARVSAAMEGIEVWHAEYCRAQTVHPSTPGSEMELPYRVGDLATIPGSLVTESTRFDWVLGSGLVSSLTTPVPTDTVHLFGPHEQRWRPPGIQRSSNGLASGNVREEAALHGLYEVIERDATSRTTPSEHLAVTGNIAGSCDLLERIRAAGATVQVSLVPNRFSVPCFMARIWSPDFPVVSIGSGAHLAADVALSRAVTEAAQSRLTGIVGSRDDLPALYHQVRDAAHEPLRIESFAGTWDEDMTDTLPRFGDLSDELRYLAILVQRVVGVEPILVDLSSDNDFSVVKVVVPGTAFNAERVHGGV